MSDEHRTKIANSQILKRLIEFSEGKDDVNMSPHQVTAAMGLLKKVMPDAKEPSPGDSDENPLVLKVISGVPRD